MLILEADRLSVAFGGVRAVNEVCIAVESGQVFSIIGPNGSGKTTLFNLISGIYRPNHGSIRFAGETVTGLEPDRLARRGLSRTFQNLQIFSRMSVLENVMVGHHRHEDTGILADLVHWPSVKRQNAATREVALAALARVGLADEARRASDSLSYGALKRLVDRPRQRNLLLIGLGGVGMMGLAFAQAMFKQKISVADLSPATRETALKNGAAVAYDPSEAEVSRRIIKETEGGFDEIVDFAGNEKSMAFAVSVLARGGKIVVSGLMGGSFSLPMVQWVYKRMTIEGFMVGTLAEGRELMALARAGKIKPTPMREEPMADVQKWIDALRAGKVVGRVVLKN